MGQVLGVKRMSARKARAISSAATAPASKAIDLSDHKVTVCFGRSCTDNRPKAVELSMTELANRFSKPDAARGQLPLAQYLALDKTLKEQKAVRDREKNGEYFIPATFKRPRTRCATDVALVHGFAGDIDTGSVSRAEIEAKLSAFLYIAYSSYSHCAMEPRWRFFVPYLNPIAPNEHQKAYALFQQLFSGQLDPRCKTTNQIWYTPACPPDAEQSFEFLTGKGQPLDVDDIQSATPPTPRAPQHTAAPSASGGASIETLLHTACVDGERTAHVLRLAGALIASGLGLPETIERCRIWNAGNVEPLEESKIESTCKSIFNSDLRNHPERHVVAANEPLFKLQDGRVDRYLATPPPPRRWLLEGLIALGKTAAVVAPGGSSKSQLVLQLGVSVGTGVDLAGQWKVGTIGGVLVLCAEDETDEIHRRLHRIKNHLTSLGKAPQLAPLADRLYVFSTIGIDTLLTRRRGNGEIEQTAVINEIVSLALKIPEIALIVIDPVSRFRGGEENSNEDGTRFVEALEKLAKLTGATVLVTHHAAKGSYGSAEVTQGASRGASSLTDGLRWQLNLNPPTEKQADAVGVARHELKRHVMATVTKTNYSAMPEPVILRREDDGYLTAVSASQALAGAETASIVRVLRVLDDSPAPLTARQLEDQFGGTKKATGLSKSRLREIIKLAADRGLLVNPDRRPVTITQAGTDVLRCNPPLSGGRPAGRIAPIPIGARKAL